MKLIIGLGNPGLRYKKTRHNVGWLALEYIRNYESGIMNQEFKKWKKLKNVQAEISERPPSVPPSQGGKGEIILAKPLTYMNRSGIAVKALITNLRLTTNDLIVLHDDVDIKFGEIKSQSGRGAAGHNGVQSIIDTLGTNDFTRIRVGIKPETPLNSPLRKGGSGTEKFVLSKFSRAELKKLATEIFPEILDKII